MEVSKNIRYIGVNDHQVDLFEGQFPVPEGMAYNSYLILDEKPTVMDSVDAHFTEEWLSNLERELEGRQPAYLVVQHMEPDHSGSLKAFADKYPEAVIVSSMAAFRMMKNYFGTDYADRRVLAAEGQTLSLGSHELQFVAAPMVHWPEVTMTYEKTEKVLFSADAFGKFGALDVESDEEDLDESIREGAEKERLFEAARNGDEEAMETLTMSDLDMFQSINLRMENEDLYSVVEQSLMPSGIECDQYSVIGEITGVSENVNYRTNEELWLISLSCNSVEFNLCIRKDDLLGEPLPGRRLKCRIWLTGRVDFTNPVLPGDPDAV